MSESRCPFCNIAKAYPPAPSYVPEDPDTSLILPNCFLLLSTESVLAFLDIMPITSGHVLVIPRVHREKLGDLRSAEGAALGLWLPIICNAVLKALGREGGDWNVVQNNGASAAQVVPHVHYHIIPRGGAAPDAKARSWTMFGRGQREDLDEEEAAKLSASIRHHLQKDIEEMSHTDPTARALLGKL